MSKKKKQGGKPISAIKPLPTRQGQDWKYMLAALVGSFLVFLNALQNGFVNWDDPANFLENPWIANTQNLGIFERISGIFSSDVLGGYHPLSTSSFLIDKALFGFDNPAGWHVINVMLHLVVVALVFRLCRLLGMQLWGAFLMALIFGIHPMHVESVAWVTERKDVLFATFYFAALIQYVHYRKGKAGKHIIGTYIFFILALLSKIQAVSLPLSMVLIDYLASGKIDFKGILSKWGFFALSLITGIAGILLLKEEGSLSTGEEYGLLENIVLSSWSLVVYLYKFVIPYPLSSYYPYPEVVSGNYYLSLGVVPLIIAILFWSYRKGWKVIFFGMGFFLVNLVFLLQFVKAGQGYLADRFGYVAYFGLSYVLVSYFLDGLSFSAWRKNLVQGGMVLFVLMLALLAFRQNKVWENGETLWGNVIDHFPDQMRPYVARGNYHYRQQNFAQALEDFNAALNRKENEEVYGNRAKIYMQSGNTIQNFQLALQDLNRAIELNPRNAEHYVNRGVIYTKTSEFDQAVQDFSQAIALNPRFAQAVLNRGKLYKFQGQLPQAVQDYNAYLQLDDSSPNIWYEKAEMESSLQMTDAALQSINQCIERNPNICNAYLLRSMLFQNKGNQSGQQSDLAKARQLGCAR